MIPRSVLRSIERNQYYIGYGQTLQKGDDVTKPNASPKTSFITLFQHGKYLCNVVYDTEIDNVRIEFRAKRLKFDYNLLGFFVRILGETGSRRWISPEIGERMTPPKDLESLFIYSSKNSHK